MSADLLVAEPWPDPLDIVGEPRAWLALAWPVVQVALGGMQLGLLTAGYAMSLSFVPFAIGLPMLSLVTRAAWHVAGFEARVATSLAGLPSAPAQELPPATGFLLGLGDLLSLSSAWTRPFGLLLTLPFGVAGLGLVTTAFALSFGFLAAGIAGAAGWVQVSLEGWVLPPSRGPIQALWILGGLAGMLATLHLAYGWLRMHARIWRALS
jgi:hypothetical protein